MRIALIVPPARRANTAHSSSVRATINDLASALRRLGHTVTTFPSDETRGSHDTVSPTASPYHELAHATRACRQMRHSLEPFDIVHCHLAAALPFARLFPAPVVHTAHHACIDGMDQFYAEFPDVTLTFPWSEHARRHEPGCFVVPYGFAPEQYPFGDGAGGYVLLARATLRGDATRAAIEAARMSGLPLLLSPDDDSYGTEPEDDDANAADEVFDVPRAEVGRRIEMLRNARALVQVENADANPDVALIEAMLCGTPIVALDSAVARETIEDGVTGRIVSGVESLADAIRSAHRLDRSVVRARAIERFADDVMARAFVAIYDHAIERRRSGATRSSMLLAFEASAAH